jgi:hypothetical protein
VKQLRIGVLVGLFAVAGVVSWAGSRLWDTLGSLPSVPVAAPIVLALIAVVLAATAISLRARLRAQREREPDAKGVDPMVAAWFSARRARWWRRWSRGCTAGSASSWPWSSWTYRPRWPSTPSVLAGAGVGRRVLPGAGLPARIGPGLNMQALRCGPSRLISIRVAGSRTGRGRPR